MVSNCSKLILSKFRCFQPLHPRMRPVMPARIVRGAPHIGTACFEQLNTITEAGSQPKGWRNKCSGCSRIFARDASTVQHSWKHSSSFVKEPRAQDSNGSLSKRGFMFREQPPRKRQLFYRVHHGNHSSQVLQVVIVQETIVLGIRQPSLLITPIIVDCGLPTLRTLLFTIHRCRAGCMARPVISTYSRIVATCPRRLWIWPLKSNTPRSSAYTFTYISWKACKFLCLLR